MNTTHGTFTLRPNQARHYYVVRRHAAIVLTGEIEDAWAVIRVYTGPLYEELVCRCRHQGDAEVVRRALEKYFSRNVDVVRGADRLARSIPVPEDHRS